jgi:hypothetical protein
MKKFPRLGIKAGSSSRFLLASCDGRCCAGDASRIMAPVSVMFVAFFPDLFRVFF